MIVLSSLSDPDLAKHVLDGNVGVLPTDTIYGIVARAVDTKAVARLYAIKHREGKPGTVVAASVSQLRLLGLNDSDIQKVAHLWPNPISIVLPAPEMLSYLHQGKGSVAVRVTKNPELRQLLEQTGPLLTSSANWPGEAPAQTVDDARDYFGDEVDFYVDGGMIPNDAASTVARLETDGQITVLRQGSVAITQEMNTRGTTHDV